MPPPLRLGVNIDHVATIRNARGIQHPDPVRAARIAAEAGADGITAHLREDRRHINDTDITQLKSATSLPLNLEMAATEEMLAIALATQPHAVCLVPEKRAELTTEGGLDIHATQDTLRPFMARLQEQGIRVSLFIDPEFTQLHTAHTLGADIVELHTGTYCNQTGTARQKELERLIKAAQQAEQYGLECHAGHGLSYETTPAIAAIPQIVELNIGHFLIGEAIFTGLHASIQQMRQVMDRARA